MTPFLNCCIRGWEIYGDPVVDHLFSRPYWQLATNIYIARWVDGDNH